MDMSNITHPVTFHIIHLKLWNYGPAEIFALDGQHSISIVHPGPDIPAVGDICTIDIPDRISVQMKVMATEVTTPPDGYATDAETQEVQQ